MLQKMLLIHMKENLPTPFISEYDGITKLFQDFTTDKVTDFTHLDALMHKGGNAFFNHLLFGLFYGKAWSFVCDFEDAPLYLRDHSDPRGVHMTSLIMPFIYRLLYRYVIVRLRDHEVITRSAMWFVDPKKCLWEALSSRIINGAPQDREVNRAIVMLESTCRCMIHTPHLSTNTLCRCCKDLSAYNKRASKF